MSFIFQTVKVHQEERLPEIAVMIPIPDLFSRFVSKAPGKMSCVKKFDFSSSCSSQDGMFAAVGPFVGASAGAMLLERLCIKGITKIIFFGFCGALCGDMEFGDIVIPETGFSEEGVSRLYGYETSIPSPSSHIAEVLKMVATEMKTSVFSGGIWSTDAPFMETTQKVAQFRKSGAVAVDMESTALMSVGKYRGVEMASLLVVTDNISSKTWETGFYGKGFKQGVKRGMEIVFNAVDNLSKEPQKP